MTQPTEPSVFPGVLESSVPAEVQDEPSLSEAFKSTLKISQVSLETESREKPEHEDPEQHEQTVCPAVAETPSTESKWEVGSRCRVAWSGDGLVALQTPNTVLQMESQNSQGWKPGSPCRAMFSEDGLFYPAVVLWVKGQRCRVRFNNYNNEEDQDIGSLLNPDELYGPSRATTEGNRCRSASTSSNPDRKGCRRRAETQGERGGGEPESALTANQQNSLQVKEKSWNQRKLESAGEKKSRNQQRDEAEKPAHHSFSVFPPFPPPPQPGSANPLSFIPPPPAWMFRGGESSSSASVEPLSSMLTLWYMCGFHTGTYMAQQLSRSTSKD
ncbi:hypothetical protein Q5P01_015577 [Channa striata]|uniref:Tudor domain-containing protein n=1 Tax=Channa striata TaxID=64152 RepID=A0AA88SKM6_CHASR|nr:hypothetical protein Q5P01_015577 [Channa striata]